MFLMKKTAEGNAFRGSDLGLSMQGKAGCKTHAVRDVFNVVAGSMLLQNHPHQIQAQAATAAFAVAGLLFPVERLK